MGFIKLLYIKMGIILISASFLNNNFSKALENNLDLLCQEFNLDFSIVMNELMKSQSRLEMNQYLKHKFDGQIKIVD